MKRSIVVFIVSIFIISAAGLFACSREQDPAPVVRLGKNYELKFSVVNSWGMAEVNFYEKGFYCPPVLVRIIYYDQENQKHELLDPSANEWQVWEQRFLDLRSKLRK